jgi:hypothetical protein
MSYVPPTDAVVRFRCEPATSARLARLGLRVFESGGGPVAEYPCPADGDLFAQAAARSEVEHLSAEDVLVADLSEGASVLYDENPLGREWEDPNGLPAAWREPELFKQPLTLFRLATESTIDDVPIHLLRWMQQVPDLDPDALPAAHGAWRDRLNALERLAYGRVCSVFEVATDGERREFDGSLSQIRRVLRWGTNDEFDLAITPFTNRGYVESVESIVNDKLARIYKLADELEMRPVEVQQRERLQGEIELLVQQHLSQVSDRLRMIVEADMLSQSTGVARADLLQLLRPGWEWADGPLKEAVNPPENALATLLEARKSIDPDTQLGYRPTGRREGRYVLVADFLGRSIVGELDKINLEVPLAVRE